MSRDSGGKRVGWPRRILGFIVSFAASLAISAVLERVMDAEFIHAAHAAQERWLEAAAATAPLAIAETFWTELEGAITGDPDTHAWSVAPSGGSRGVTSPLVALVFTIAKVGYHGGIAVLVQIALAALAVLVFFARRSSGNLTAIFEQPYTVLIGAPLLIMAVASLLGLALWAAMWAALKFLGAVTGLAGTMAGATGVLGFCWVCIQKLTERGAEHVVSSRL